MQTGLAPYAAIEQNSRGREFNEPPHKYRSAFERDRDRIIHCSAFRRLEGKTQVFTTGLNDHYRTRLTHSIEVAQVGRTIARALNLNETLTEAICLAHDLGHSPFGHIGEAALNQLTANCGGFEHNRQSLRIVKFLEHPYPDFPGLNLMYETRQSLAKHHTTNGTPAHQICLEGQIADIADRIAYSCHDLEDGLRSRILNEPQLRHIVLYQLASDEAGADAMDDYVVRRTRLSKTILDYLVSETIDASKTTLARHNIVAYEQVLAHPTALICLSDTTNSQLSQLGEFLQKNLYYHPSIAEQTPLIYDWLGRLYEKFCAAPKQLPRYYQKMIDQEGLGRTICDYISGMTDRFARQCLEEEAQGT